MDSGDARMIQQHEVEIWESLKLKRPNGEIDFQVWRYMRTRSHPSSKWQVFLARTLEELKTIYTQDGGRTYVEGFDEAFFEEQAVVVWLWHSQIGPHTVVDRLTVAQNRLKIHLSTGYPSMGAQLPLQYRILLAVDSRGGCNFMRRYPSGFLGLYASSR